MNAIRWDGARRLPEGCHAFAPLRKHVFSVPRMGWHGHAPLRGHERSAGREHGHATARGHATRLVRFTLVACGLLVFGVLACGTASAASWAERAATMNRKEISAGEAVQRGGDKDKDRRGRIAMRRIRPAMKSVDWDTDPTAIPSALVQFNKRTDLPVAIDNDGIDLATSEIFEYTVLYLTAHNAWSLNEKEVENLSRWLKRGGTLVLDDCYLRGSAFGECVKPEVARLIPAAEPTFLLKEDPRVSDVFKMLYPTPWPGEEGGFENRPWQYYLLDGRPAVLFTPNDDGCSWEYSTPPSASNPLGEPIGHGGDNRQREVVFQWLVNWMLFAFTH